MLLFFLGRFVTMKIKSMKQNFENFTFLRISGKHGVARELWRNVKGEDIRDITTISSYPLLPNEVSTTTQI